MKCDHYPLIKSGQHNLSRLCVFQADTLEVLSDLREVRRQMDKTAIDRRHKLQEEKDKIVSQMIVDGLKVRAGECSMYLLCVIFFPVFVLLNSFKKC